MVQGQCM